MTTVISFLGGPGCGKSTIAAELYAKMKRKHMNVELVREVAKEWAWEGRKIGPFEQLAILGKQIQKESSLYTKVQYLITDSPVLLGAFYFEHNHKQTFANQMVRSYYSYAFDRQNVKFLNYMISRKKDYNPEGRFESEEQARQIDRQLGHYLKFNNYKFQLISEVLTESEIVDAILGDLNA